LNGFQTLLLTAAAVNQLLLRDDFFLSGVLPRCSSFILFFLGLVLAFLLSFHRLFSKFIV